MIIVFDLDYTLFDAEKFRKGLAPVFNMSEFEHEEVYKKIFKNKNRHYNAYDLIEILFQNGKMNKEDVLRARKDLEIYLKSVDDFIFPGSINIIENLKLDGHKLILFSYGDSQWQNAKIDNLFLKKYFFEIVVTEELKYRNLDFLINKPEKKIIINDNAEENLILKKYLNNSDFFLVKGPYCHNIEHNFKVYSLDQAYQEIKNNY